jgi:hypothetical protein
MSKLKEIGKLKLEAQNPENVRGVVRFWQVQSAAEISDDNWEKDTEQVFEKTYITEQLMQTIKRITDSVNGEREKSAFVFEGTYGTGKSHSLLTIYHIFKHPELAKDYFPSLKELEIPKIDHIIILSHYRNEKNLWEPLYESIAPEQKQLIQDYPAIENLISLLKNKKVLIFLDETENWFATRSDEILIQRNLNFLQNLFEAVSGRDSQTAVIQTVLGRDNRLKNIINRNSETINLNIKDIERKQIISHRLFETLNKEKRQQTISAYAKALKNYQVISRISEYEEDAGASYPFSPYTLEKILETYSMTESNQSVRGALYICAKALKRAYETDQDMVLLHDFQITDEEIEQEVSSLDSRLVSNALEDIRKRFQNDSIMAGIISSILLSSFNGLQNNGLSFNELIIETIRPSRIQKNDLEMKLNKIKKEAWYVQNVAERYKLTKEQNLSVRIEEISQTIKEHEAKFEQIKVLVGKHIKNKLNEEEMQIMFTETDAADILRDTRNFKIICSDTSLSTEETVEKYYKGRTYMNAISVLTPKTKSIFNKNSSVVLSGAKYLACDELKVSDSTIKTSALDKYKNQFEKDLEKAIEGAYGMIFTLAPSTDQVNGMYRELPNLKPLSIIDIIEDNFNIKQSIYKIIEASKTDGVEVESILEDMRKFPRYAQYVKKDTVTTILREMTRGAEEQIGHQKIKTHEGRYYLEEHFPELRPDPVIPSTLGNQLHGPQDPNRPATLPKQGNDSVNNIYPTHPPKVQPEQIQEQEIIREDKTYHEIRNEIESIGHVNDSETIFTYFSIEGKPQDLEDIPTPSQLRQIFNEEANISMKIELSNPENRIQIEIREQCTHRQITDLFSTLRITGRAVTQYKYLKR